MTLAPDFSARPTGDAAPFWAACARSELVYQCCDDCGAVQSPPRRVCEACRGQALAWLPSRGLGDVYSFAVVRTPPEDAPDTPVPHVLALVRFDEGAQMMMQMGDVMPEHVEIGQRVRVVFAPSTGGQRLPQAVPV